MRRGTCEGAHPKYATGSLIGRLDRGDGCYGVTSVSSSGGSVIRMADRTKTIGGRCQTSAAGAAAELQSGR